MLLGRSATNQPTTDLPPLRPWDTLYSKACCWDVQQPTNKSTASPSLKFHVAGRSATNLPTKQQTFRPWDTLAFTRTFSNQPINQATNLPPLGYTSMLRGRSATNQPTNQPSNKPTASASLRYTSVLRGCSATNQATNLPPLRPWDTLACYWDVEQPANQPSNKPTAPPPLGYTSMLLGRSATKQPNKQQTYRLSVPEVH